MKRLLSVFIGISLMANNAFAMQQQKPVTEPISNQSASQAVNQDAATCCICIENIEENQHYTSLPCNHTLHFDCFQHYSESAGKNKCPLCRAAITEAQLKSLKESASGVYKKITITDYNGVTRTIDDVEIINALNQCQKIKNNSTSECSFTSDDDKPATIENILRLADYIKNPRLIASQSIDINKQMLDLANNLKAPANVLFELANILWPHLQENDDDSYTIKWEKLKLCKIARPYLHCPEQFLKILRAHQNPGQAANSNIDLSHASLVAAHAENQWVRADDNLLYNTHHKFCSLKGLRELLVFLGVSDEIDNISLFRKKIDLSGHSIRYFRLSEIQGNFGSVNLSHNCITTLDAEKFNAELPHTLDLSHNNISSVNPSMYELVKQWRMAPGGTAITIDISHNAITAKQSDEIRAQWYQATDTLAERMYWKLDHPGISPVFLTRAALGCGFGTIGTGYTVNHMISNSSNWVRYPTIAIASVCSVLINGISAILTQRNHDSILHSTIMGAQAGACLGTYAVTNALNSLPISKRIPVTLATIPTSAGFGAATVWLLSKLPKPQISRYIASLLAKISHPEIKFGDDYTVWNANKPKLIISNIY